MGRGRDTAGYGATRGDGRNGTHLEGGGDTAGDERGARDLSMRPVRLAIYERPLREDRSTRFISPMNVVVSRLVESHLRVSVLMRDLREGSGGADVDPLRVATLAGFAVTFAMAAALRQRRTNNAAQADDDDDEPAAARPRSRASKSAKSSSDATGRSSLRHRGVVIALLAALLGSIIAYIARDRIPFPTSLGKPDPVRATVRALSAVNRLAPAPVSYTHLTLPTILRV